MIDPKHDVEIDGTLFKIAWDQGEEAYMELAEPLRHPASQVVSGDSEKFNIRPDILLWSWTDWSEGEGQIKYDPQQPGRSHYLEGAEPFLTPGQVGSGPMFDDTKDNGEVNDFAKLLSFTKARGGLWGVDASTQDDLYFWDDNNEKWGAALNNTVAGATRPAAYGGAAGDQNYVYYIEDLTDEVYRYDGTTFILLNDQTSATGDSPMVAFDDYLYILDMLNAKVYEISKFIVNTTTPEVEILDLSTKGGLTSINSGIGQLCVGENRLYVMQNLSNDTILWEITPSSAAGTGFATRLYTLEGFRGEAIWFHLGLLYVIGTDNDPSAISRVILYFQPGGSMGTLGRIRADAVASVGPAVAGQMKSMLQSFFILPTTVPGEELDPIGDVGTAVWVVEHITGGFGAYALYGAVSGDLDETEELIPVDAITYRNQHFMSVIDSSPLIRVPRAAWGNTPIGGKGSIVVSPRWDGGVADEKILLSVETIVESLPPDVGVAIAFELDGDGSWFDAGTYFTEGDVGGTFIISTSTATKTFRSLRIRLTNPGEATPDGDDDAAVVTAVNVRARVQSNITRYVMLLDAYDSASEHQGPTGATKFSSLETIRDAADVIKFKNGARSSEANTFDTVDVVVDSYRFVLKRPGQGYGLVELVEVR